jgi:type II secretory pathway pseudopilin PulG
MANKSSLLRLLVAVAVLAAIGAVIIVRDIWSQRAADQQNEVENAAKATRAMTFAQPSEAGK